MTSIDFIFKHAKRQSQYTMFEIIVEFFFKNCLYLLLIVVFLIVYMPIIPFHLWRQSGFRQRKIEI